MDYKYKYLKYKSKMKNMRGSSHSGSISDSGLVGNTRGRGNDLSEKESNRFPSDPPDLREGFSQGNVVHAHPIPSAPPHPDDPDASHDTQDWNRVPIARVLDDIIPEDRDIPVNEIRNRVWRLLRECRKSERSKDNELELYRTRNRDQTRQIEELSNLLDIPDSSELKKWWFASMRHPEYHKINRLQRFLNEKGHDLRIN